MIKHLSQAARALFSQVQFLGIAPGELRVDPACFPEQEFPTVCLRCAYRIVGPVSGRCPECGQEFERGRLLVELYVRECGVPFWKHSAWGTIVRWSWRIQGLCLLVCMVGFIVAYAATKCADPTAPVVRSVSVVYDTAALAFMAVMGVLGVLAVLNLVVYVVAFLAIAKRRSRIIERLRGR